MDSNQAAVMRVVRSAFSRMHEQVQLVRKAARVGDWTPQPHQCHDNVREWVAKNPRHIHVYGYLLFDFRLMNGCFRLTAHSVVEDENGTLHDITPSGASADYPFIRHVGSEEDFAITAELRQIDVREDFIQRLLNLNSAG
jgi:hypothetical protein